MKGTSEYRTGKKIFAVKVRETKLFISPPLPGIFRGEIGEVEGFFIKRNWSMKSRIYLILYIVGIVTVTGLNAADDGRQQRDARIEALEQRIEKMEEEKQEILKMLEELSNEEVTRKGEEEWYDRLSLGGYGESHFNFLEGKGNDYSDLHRFVLYLGYDFSDWIKLHSETEIEHAFVAEGNGEVSMEQLYVDLMLSKYAGIRVGRVLTPLGIINTRHEPTTFNGVERPSFAKYMIPTPWSAEGVGIFGNVNEGLSWEMYLNSGVDGVRFGGLDGIRGGRMKERPGLSDPAFSARVDYSFPSIRSLPAGQDLRLGVSFWTGGLNNGNKGSTPGVDADMKIYSVDAEYSIASLDFRGVAAYEKIDGAASLGNNTASDLFGYYLEAAWHVWPGSFRKGILKESDAVLFARYDNFDTQFKRPEEAIKNPAGDREELTFGISFFPVENLVFKMDYQMPEDGTGRNLENRFNLGVGWYLY